MWTTLLIPIYTPELPRKLFPGSENAIVMMSDLGLHKLLYYPALRSLVTFELFTKPTERWWTICGQHPLDSLIRFQGMVRCSFMSRYGLSLLVLVYASIVSKSSSTNCKCAENIQNADCVRKPNGDKECGSVVCNDGYWGQSCQLGRLR